MVLVKNLIKLVGTWYSKTVVVKTIAELFISVVSKMVFNVTVIVDLAQESLYL